MWHQDHLWYVYTDRDRDRRHWILENCVKLFTLQTRQRQRSMPLASVSRWHRSRSRFGQCKCTNRIFWPLKSDNDIKQNPVRKFHWVKRLKRYCVLVQEKKPKLKKDTVKINCKSKDLLWPKNLQALILCFDHQTKNNILIINFISRSFDRMVDHNDFQQY